MRMMGGCVSAAGEHDELVSAQTSAMCARIELLTLISVKKGCVKLRLMPL